MTRGPRAAHPSALGHSVRDPVLHAAYPGGREGLRLRVIHPPWPSTSHGSLPDGLAHPGRNCGPADDGDGGAVGASCPSTPQASFGHLKAKEGLRTLDVPCPPLPGAPADGLPIPVSFDRVEHDSHEGQQDADDPAGGTVHGLTEGDNGRASAKHLRHHYRGPLQLHSDTEAGDKEKTRLSTASKPGDPGAAAVTAARPGPTS